MRNDYTLVVPTYNRCEDLSLLLSYLEAQEADFRILVLDSSAEDKRAVNRENVRKSRLPLDYHEFDVETHPFDKFRAGINLVETPFCSLCADDDIPILPGLASSVDHLKAEPEFSVAHGYYFQFSRTSKTINLATITYYTPDIADPEPVARIHSLMRHYQALTYGVYRTPVLRYIFDSVQPVTSLLGRELLSSVLATVRGKIARVPGFYMGRNLGPSSGHVHWHPLEWSIESPEGLFAEYGRYRDILIRQVMDMPDNGRSASDVARLLDLIHLHYLVRHTPEESLDFAVDALSAGRDPADIFSAPEVTHPLIDAAARYAAKGEKPSPRAAADASAPTFNRRMPDELTDTLYQRLLSSSAGRARTLIKRLRGTAGADRAVKQDGATAASRPANEHIRTDRRNYVLQQAFHTPPEAHRISLADEDRSALLTCLDCYG